MGIIKKIKNKIVNRYFSELEAFALDKDVPLTQKMHHTAWKQELVKLANENNLKVLEIGSREVTGPSSMRSLMNNASYTGFDYYPGDNVDVVGDAHKLSSYFDEKFDLIFSSAVFEHLAMPWIAAEEINKLLNVGGYVFVETHYSFSSHERPWHFFQFSDMALQILFNSEMGFECIEAGACNPIAGRFSSDAADYLKYHPVSGLYCHSEYFGKKVREVENYNWRTADMNKILSNTVYPEPKA